VVNNINLKLTSITSGGD